MGMYGMLWCGEYKWSSSDQSDMSLVSESLD